MFDVIIVANGKSARAQTDKLSARLGESTVLAHTIAAFSDIPSIKNIILVTDSPYEYNGVTKVGGGKTRSESVKNGLAVSTAEYVLIHDGARPFVSRDLIKRIMADTLKYGSSVPYTPVSDSLRKLSNGTASYVDRADYVTLQTPQGFIKAKLADAYNQCKTADYYDDSELYAKFVAPVHFILGETKNKKITVPEDVYGYNMKIGSGFDVHKFADNGKPLVLGGITIPYAYGLDAHSDGDVIIHAVMDALLSSANQPDIGVLFPDTSEAYKDIDSTVLLNRVTDILHNQNININNISVTVIAQKPHLAEHLPSIQKRLAELLNVDTCAINLTATTTEKLGIVGEGRAIAVLAVASVF